MFVGRVIHQEELLSKPWSQTITLFFNNAFLIAKKQNIPFVCPIPVFHFNFVMFFQFSAALQSVFPQTELGTYMSLVKKDKERQLIELALIVTGIRLFNRDCGKGGEGIDNSKLLVYVLQLNLFYFFYVMFTLSFLENWSIESFLVGKTGRCCSHYV